MLFPRSFVPFVSVSALLVASATNCDGSESGEPGEAEGGAAGNGDPSDSAMAGSHSKEDETPAIYCRTDKTCHDLGKLCDTERSVCVDCLETSDCGTNELCRRNDCVPITPCESSKSCALDEICSETLGYCVNCEGDNDCATGETCRYFSCLPSCESDKDCAQSNEVCQKKDSVCVDCVVDADCDDDQWCNEVGLCIDELCATTDVFCDGDLLTSCAERGTGFVSTECPVGCEANGDAAACIVPVCTTGDEGCSCYPNDTCNGDLSCVSGLCVDDSTSTGDGDGTGGSSGTGGSGMTGGSSGTGGSGMTGGTGGCDTGEETCECYPNNTCNSELICDGEICIKEDGSGGSDNGSGGNGSGGNGSGGAGCITIDAFSTYTATRYPSSPPFSYLIDDGQEITALGYGWVGWYEYEINIPASGFYYITVRVADDAWKEGTPSEIYNAFAISLDGMVRLEFDGSTDVYDDITTPSGDRTFHNLTGTVFGIDEGTFALRVDNLNDAWTDGDDMELYFAYINVCPYEL